MLEIISRKEAKALGLKRYFTGKSCKNSHFSERVTVNGQCMKCTNEKNVLSYAEDRNGRRTRALARYAERSEEMSAYSRAYYHANKEHCVKRYAEWIKKNPDSRRVRKARRTALKRLSGGSYTAADVAAIFIRQRGKCAECGISLGKYHVDHIMPLKLGGLNIPKNLQILCPPCNQRKHAKHPIDWARENGRLL